MFILYMLFTIFCCIITAKLVENKLVNTLKNNDKYTLEMIEQLSNYICENKKQIQENVRVTNKLTNRVFYNK